MSTAKDRIDDLRSMLQPVFARFPEIAAVYLFGSVARGEAGPLSDLDLGLVFTRRPEEAWGGPRLLGRLEAEVARATSFVEVDLIDLERQGPMFRHRVLCRGKRLYEGDPRRRIEFETETTRHALDFQQTYEIATRGKLAAYRRWLKSYGRPGRE